MLSNTTMLLLAAMLLVFKADLSQGATVIVKDDVALAEDIVDWVRSKGGFFSEKLEIQRVDIQDSTSPLGVFAKEDIQKDERLLEVPHSCFIGLWDEAKVIDYEDEDPNMQDYYHNVCALSHKLAAELNLGDESEYTPYIEYVRQQQRGQTPATWTAEGKDLMRKVAFEGSDIVDWMDKKYKDCDPFDAHMLALTVQRGYDTTFIPIWDMLNHRNGHVNTRNDPMYANNGLLVWARTDIQKGQEVYATYDECADCGPLLKWFWGTREILRDFGFVEQYRQRWVYEDEEIWFEITDENGELEIVWDISDDDYEGDYSYGVPDEEGLTFLRTELERLQRLGEKELKDPKQIPAHEWNTILQFHQASTTALSMAIESAEAFYAQEDQEL